MSKAKTKLLAVSRKNPCPICDRTSSCSVAPGSDFVLCHGFSDGFGYPPGWKFLGQADDPTWGIYLRDRGDIPQDELDSYRREKAKKDREAQENLARQYAQGLTPEARDRAFRAIGKALGLSSSHRELLKARGLDDEAIATGGFFTVDHYPIIPPWIDCDRLPGIRINHNGDRFFSYKQRGIFCPAFDAQGRIIGGQIRDEDRNAQNRKYLWALGTFPSHLQNGELPITSMGKEHGGDPWLMEAVLKPYLSSHHHRIWAIGASGGNFTGGTEQLRDYLDGVHRVIVAPDAGDVRNPNKIQQWDKQITYLEGMGLDVSVAWWGQVTKDSPDIDELENLDDVEYLTPEQWRSLTKQDRQWAAVFGGGRGKRVKAWKKFTPDIELNQDYLDGESLIKAIAPHGFKGTAIMIKAPLGGFKTGAMIAVLAGLISSGECPNGALWLSYINRLLFNTVARGNEYFSRDDIGLGNMFKHIHGDQGKFYIRLSQVINSCINSLPYYDDADFDRLTIIIDEPISTIAALLDGGTLTRDGSQGMVAHKIMEALRRCENLFCLDGNMTDRFCRLIQEISGKKILKIENRPQNPRRYKINHWGDRELAIAYGIDRLKQGYRVAFTADSKGELRRIYQQILDLGFTTDEVKIIDQDANESECPPDLLRNPCDYLLAHQEIRCLIFSPSANSGFDVDGAITGDGGKIFDDLIGFFDGTIGTFQVHQQLFRLRSPLTNRHLFISETGNAPPRPHSYTEHGKRILEDGLTFTAAGLPPEMGDRIRAINEEMINVFLDSPLVKYEQELRNIEEIQRSAFRESCLEHLRSQYCEIVPWGIIPDDLMASAQDGAIARKEIGKAIKEAQKQQIQDDAVAIVIAPDSSDDLEALKESDPTYARVEVSHIDRREKLESSLPGFTRSESFTPDNVATIIGNPEIVQNLTRFTLLGDEARAIAQLEKRLFDVAQAYNQGIAPWLGDIPLDAIRIVEANKLGLMDFITEHSQKPITHDSPSVINLHAQLRKKRTSKRLGVRVGKDPIKAIKAFLKPWGFILVKDTTTKGRRSYRVAPAIVPSLHCQVLRSLSVKFGSSPPVAPDWRSILACENQGADQPGYCNKNPHYLHPSETRTMQGIDTDFGDKKIQAKNPPDFTQLSFHNLPPQLTQKPAPEKIGSAIAPEVENPKDEFGGVAPSGASKPTENNRNRRKITAIAPTEPPQKITAGAKVWAWINGVWKKATVAQILPGISWDDFRVMCEGGGHWFNLPHHCENPPLIPLEAGQ